MDACTGYRDKPGYETPKTTASDLVVAIEPRFSKARILEFCPLCVKAKKDCAESSRRMVIFGLQGFYIEGRCHVPD